MTAQDSTAPTGTEVVYIPWLRGEPERVCACGFYCDEENHEECDGAAP